MRWNHKTRSRRSNGYRSLFEERLALGLQKRGVDFSYETERFNYTVVHHYTPDFILANGVLVEVKGYFTSADRTKHLKVRECNPTLDIRFCSRTLKTSSTKKARRATATGAKSMGFNGAKSNTRRMGFINTHLPCEECGSSDGLAVNEDESSKCFVCGTFTPGRNNQHNKEQNTQMQPAEQHRDTPQFIQGDVMALPNRGLHKDVCQRYDYRIGEHNGKPCHVATYRNPERTIVSQKVRFEGKDFTSIGSPAYFWGQHLWPNGGKRLTITEGEIDCLTVAQVVGEGKWPVVSLPSGAQGAKRVFQKQMKWLEKFDEVILMFDNDEPGNAAAEACSHVLPAGTCKIARLTMKDPNELLMEGRSREIVDAYWQAKVWRPDTIMTGLNYSSVSPPPRSTIASRIRGKDSTTKHMVFV